MSVPRYWLQYIIISAAMLAFATTVFGVDEACGNQSTTRFALVVGNSYDGALAGVKDAKAMAESLCDLGFSVDLETEVTLAQLDGDPKSGQEGVISKFSRSIAHAEEVVFYFSGHGYQINHENFLLPIGQEVKFDSPQFPFSKVLRALQAAPTAATKIVFLDACRQFASPPAGVTIRGLAEPKGSPANTIISFAAELNTEVPSGELGTLSPYTRVLTENIREPGLTIGQLFDRVKLLPNVPTVKTNTALDFKFREPVRLKFEVKSADDQLLIFQNGRFILAVSGDDKEGKRDDTLVLSAGENELLLMVYNARNFRSGQPWQPTQGWSYDLDIKWPVDAVVSCPDPASCFRGREVLPFKSGKHHGQIFEVARAKILVDRRSARISATIDNEVWKRNPPLWQQAQSLLWEGSFDTLGLDRRASIKELLDIYRFVKDVVSTLEISRAIDLPDLSHFLAQVYGNEELRPAVGFCMQDSEARLDDLEISIKLLLEGNVSRPFEGFDSGLSDCVQKWLSKHPDSVLFGQQAQIWTAFEEQDGPPAELVR